jgi:hypothetical protein
MKRLLLIGMLTITSHANAFECAFHNIESTTPVEKFLDNGDGTITDLRFGLMWTKCTFGQTFNAQENSCIGEGQQMRNWSAAISSQGDINATRYAEHDDWRLPNIKELHSIVERGCMNPAIRPEIFPDSINAPYWSNTPDNEVNPDLLGRIVDFADGSEFFRETNSKIYVRHVRSINN